MRSYHYTLRCEADDIGKEERILAHMARIEALGLAKNPNKE